jgi:hypothetical protein
MSWLNVADAAYHTGYHPDTIRRAAVRGDLAGSKRPSTSGRGHWRFRLEDLDRWTRGELAEVVIPIDRRRRRGA